MDQNLISTTHFLTGYDIIEQKGLVSARTVVGVGFFSEFFAYFTDVFGGRSEKLAVRLNELYEDVLYSLEEELNKKNCNGLIGVHCDFDQISGKGTFMFMLSITGTAVNAIPCKSQEKPQIPIMAIAHGKCIERKLSERSNVHTVYNVIDDLLEGLKTVDIQLLINALSQKPSSDEKVDQNKIAKIIKYFDWVYDSKQVSKTFIEKLSDTSFEKSETFLQIYGLYVKPYFEYMVKALDFLDKKAIDQYIRSLENKPRVDYTPQDVGYIDQYIAKLTELGFNVDSNPEDDLFAKMYGIKKSDTGFILDLKQAITQYYADKNEG